MTSFNEVTKKITPIYQGKVIDLQVEEVELPNGRTAQREIVKHPGAVAIIPITAEGKLVLVRQFRKALGKEIYEIPAGKLEKGEDPLQCAVRELEEETGFTAQSMNRIASFYTSPGFADEIIYLYIAEQLVGGVAQPDEDEFVETKIVTIEEAQDLIEKEKIHDAKTMFAILYWQNKQLAK